MAATVELRCDGAVLATETIAAPTGSLTLTRGTGDSVKAAWALNPSCAAGTVTTTPAGETRTHDFAIAGTSGTVETTDSAYTTKGADVILTCNDAEIAAATIDAPIITGTLSLIRGTSGVIAADWTMSRECPAVGQIVGVTADASQTTEYVVSGTSGSVFFSVDFQTKAATVTLSCDGKTLATETIAAP